MVRASARYGAAAVALPVPVPSDGGVARATLVVVGGYGGDASLVYNDVACYSFPLDAPGSGVWRSLAADLPGRAAFVGRFGAAAAAWG